MTTEADKQLDSAYNNIDCALHDINSVLVDDVDGSGDYNDEVNEFIEECHAKLLYMRAKCKKLQFKL